MSNSHPSRAEKIAHIKGMTHLSKSTRTRMIQELYPDPEHDIDWEQRAYDAEAALRAIRELITEKPMSCPPFVEAIIKGVLGPKP